MTPPVDQIREAMIAALPAAGDHWKADVRAGKHDGTPLFNAASAGWIACVAYVPDYEPGEHA